MWTSTRSLGIGNRQLVRTPGEISGGVGMVAAYQSLESSDSILLLLLLLGLVLRMYYIDRGIRRSYPLPPNIIVPSSFHYDASA
jgi:hypothetical protein